MSDEKHPNKRVCNVSYPFFRAKAKVRQFPRKQLRFGSPRCAGGGGCHFIFTSRTQIFHSAFPLHLFLTRINKHKATTLPVRCHLPAPRACRHPTEPLVMKSFQPPRSARAFACQELENDRRAPGTSLGFKAPKN